MSKHILTADGHLYHCDSYGDELYHYGVPGMKWGQRKASYAAERDAYKKSKKDLKKARKAYSKSVSGFRSFGIEGIRRANAAENRRNDADVNMVNAKAKYKAAKSKNSAKAEFNTYRKEMQKSGLVGSAADRTSGGRSTKLYESIKATKGKAYADKVQKKVENVAVKQLVGAVTVAVGASVVSGILQAKYS